MPATLTDNRSKAGLGVLLAVAAALVVGVLIWQGLTSGGNPDPTLPHTSAAVAALEIGVLVFREGLECILVLAAITASMTGDQLAYRRPIAVGSAVALVATLATWVLIVSILDTLNTRFYAHALDIQAATGLIAVVVLLIVMNWFLHKLYWTGWIRRHTSKKKELVQSVATHGSATDGAWVGFAMLGFWAVYREGFEVVLFLQTYRMRLVGWSIGSGVVIGAVLAAIVAVLVFVMQRRLPHKKMLVATGVLLGVVLLVMVGEQVQEMQQAHWIPTAPLTSLANVIPSWAGLWFSVFPDAATLGAQFLAVLLVLGSYYLARRQGLSGAAA